MYYIGLDVHKKTISYCVKDASGRVHREGKLGATRCELDGWMRTLPRPWTVAMEATIFTGWIYDHLHPHATQVKVAHPLMLRAIAAAKKKTTGSTPVRSPIFRLHHLPYQQTAAAQRSPSVPNLSRSHLALRQEVT